MRKISAAKRARLLRMYADGEKMSYVCSLLDVCSMTARKYARMAGLLRPRGRPPVAYPANLAGHAVVPPVVVYEWSGGCRVCKHCDLLIAPQVGSGRPRLVHAECSRAARQARDKSYYATHGRESVGT